MLFNSIDFAIFLPIVFSMYWLIKNYKLQNLLIILASYIFYGWWDWRFLSLIIFSTLVDYFVGLKISKEKNEVNRKFFLWGSILVNLGFLGFFKYYNFFIDNFTTAFSFFGSNISPTSLNIILPVGISFYTFQTLSYTIDVYKNKIKPTEDFFAFAAFVSFFPQLVAGPIERASNLLPQFYKKRSFKYDKAVDGMRQILWGLFKKIVIADNCAQLANEIFQNHSDLNGSTLVLGALFFTFQIYGDFSGYSDIAIGTARLFGFNLMQNFAFPYFSRDIGEFWRRWHISLSSWFRDYVYIPLGGSRGGTWVTIRNIFIIFLVSAFWHGANWTFLAWGFLNACYFLPLMLTQNNRKNLNTVAQGNIFPTIVELFQMGLTFCLTAFAWIFFRSENITEALKYTGKIFSKSLFEFPDHFGGISALTTLIIICCFMLVEWFGREQKYAIEKLGGTWKPIFRYATYYAIVFVILWFGGEEQKFIYFQF
ncbi:MBOAT family O-acyltransferase [Algibacter sp. 2305UL17-15]|uniref:MBOAT family O-acyltransferase n=1 Tax=Algibacter sp. 2305UL17-15 TaxID=3231268 RepID=UPI0034586FE3